MPHSEALIEAKMAADAAEAALNDHLRPAFDHVEALYTARLKDVAQSEPWAAGKLRALALTLKATEAARQHIEAIVAGGEVAEDQMRRIRRNESMSPERRKILGL